MQVHPDYRSVPQNAWGTSLALGNFDGLHAGHRAVIDAARMARSDCPLGVLMFEPPPRRYFQPDSPPFRIMHSQRKRTVLAGLGVRHAFEIPFDSNIAQMSPETFVRDVLVTGIGITHLSVGFDFQFGKGRAGTTETLRALGKQFGFGVTIVERVDSGREKISSSAIRAALQAGNVALAADLLGEYWQVEGEIVHGEARGRTIGFATANLTLGDVIEPAHGVYAVRARPVGQDDWIDGVANFGRTPTTGLRDPLLEVHLIDWQGDLYGQRLEVQFIERIREERRFDGLEALTTQIARDTLKAREILRQD